MMISPRSELDAGTLTENGIDDGTEVRLVPAIESGVTVSCHTSVCGNACPNLHPLGLSFHRLSLLVFI